MIMSLSDNFLSEKSEVFYNTRTKYYEDENGTLVPFEIACANRQIFKESGAELSEFSRSIDWRLEYDAANAELFGGAFGNSRHYVPTPESREYYLDCSRRRARRKIFDYIICNNFDCFITLTLDKSLIDRNDYGAVIKKLKDFLSNRVKRKGLIYLGVPEFHRNGGLHFHFCVNSSAFSLSDSGCVSVDGHKRPIKISTAKRLKIPESEWHTVYNVDDWRLGFSTAIMTYGDRGALAHYMRKELDKDCQKRLTPEGFIEKIGGRWYYSGGKLKKPIVKLENRNFNDLDGYTYDVDCAGGKFKFYVLTENGCVL